MILSRFFSPQLYVLKQEKVNSYLKIKIFSLPITSVTCTKYFYISNGLKYLFFSFKIRKFYVLAAYWAVFLLVTLSIIKPLGYANFAKDVLILTGDCWV
jgi:hypothetical protein